MDVDSYIRCIHNSALACCRVSSAPVECSCWELSVEQGGERHQVDITKTGDVFTVSTG